MLAPTYVSENAPRGIRGLLIGFYQLFETMGAMIAFFIDYGSLLHIPVSRLLPMQPAPCHQLMTDYVGPRFMDRPPSNAIPPSGTHFQQYSPMSRITTLARKPRQLGRNDQSSR